MSFKELQNFIDGHYVAACGKETFELVDPTTGKVNGISPISNAEDVDNALKVAKEAFKTWGKQRHPNVKKLFLISQMRSKNIKKH